MAVKIIYFVHGTTIDNELGLASGWSQVDLSDKGIEESKKLREAVLAKQFDAVFCSDLRRSYETAELAFGDQFPIVEDSRLKECNYGDFTGKLSKDFKGKMTDFITNPFPNGESYRDVEARVGKFLGFLKEKHDVSTVAIVAHQAPQLAFDVLVNYKSWKQAIKEDWRNSGSWKPGWEYIFR